MAEVGDFRGEVLGGGRLEPRGAVEGAELFGGGGVEGVMMGFEKR